MPSIEANFIHSSSKIGDYPRTSLPEFAFSGRSNVGKSSFINTILLRKNLAKISSNPGKTKSINFFNVQDKYILADLPGFGYAKVSKTDREQWKDMIYHYFKSREQLKFVTVLVDGRHDPMSIDLSLIEWLENHQIPFIVVMTKCDKVSKTQIEEKVEEWNYLLQSCKGKIEVLPTSSLTGLNREQFVAIIKRHLD